MSENIGVSSPAVPSASMSWYEAWLSVLINPSVKTFEELVQDPKAGARRAYTWMIISALIAGPTYVLVGFAVPGSNSAALLGEPIASLILITLFTTLIILGVALMGITLNAGVTHGIALVFGGTGTFAQLAYAYASFLAPILLINVVFASIPGIKFLGNILQIYSLILSVIALRAVHHFGLGRAVATLLLVGVLGVVLALVLIFFVAMFTF